MERRDFRDWLERYEGAWREPGTQALAGLFTTDATYRLSPYGELIEGLEAIEGLWERERKGPDEAFTMHPEVVAVEESTGVVRVAVDYGEPLNQSYLDLWVIDLRDDGRARSFEEWPFAPKDSLGGPQEEEE